MSHWLGLMLASSCLAVGCSADGGATQAPRQADGGCSQLAAHIAGASPPPEPVGSTHTNTGLESRMRSGATTEHSPSDPLESVQVLMGDGSTTIDRASLLFVVAESGKAVFGGCVAQDGRPGSQVVPVKDPDPGSPLAVVLDRVLVGGAPHNSDLTANFALVNANGRPPSMFGNSGPTSLPPLVSPSFEVPDRLVLERSKSAKCEPNCLGIGVFVYDLRIQGGSLTAKQVLARTSPSPPPAVEHVDLPPPQAHTLRVALVLSGSSAQATVEPLYVFTAQVLA